MCKLRSQEVLLHRPQKEIFSRKKFSPNVTYISLPIDNFLFRVFAIKFSNVQLSRVFHFKCPQNGNDWEEYVMVLNIGAKKS